MPGFTESNIILNFPDTNFFRFSACEGYRVLSGNHFKEMDACWHDTTGDIYWLIELKDYSLANIAAATTIESKVWDLVKKAVDSLSMFLSTKHSYPWFTAKYPNLPYTPANATIMKFITVVHCDTHQRADVQLMNDSFKNKFKPYAELFGIQYYSVVNHTSAKAIVPNNMIQ